MTTLPRIPRLLPSVLVVIAFSPSLCAQLPVPLLLSVFPPGAQAGTTVEVTINGAWIDGTTKLVFADPSLGILCEAVPNAVTPDHTDRFRLTIPHDAPPGTYDLFASSRLGLSAPRPFVIGSETELLESGTNTSSERAMVLEPGCVVNGRANANANDYYRIEANAGDKLVFTCRAENLDSRMDASLVLYDSAGRELDRDRNNDDRNAVVAFTAPRPGSYFLHVADFIYGGGDDYPYRLTVSTAPHLEFVFPPAGQPGRTETFTLYGRNLPGARQEDSVRIGNRTLETLQVEIPIPAGSRSVPGVGAVRPSLLLQTTYRLADGARQSNPVAIGLAAAPIVIEQEAPAEGNEQTVTPPCEIQGRFDRDRDFDRFRFAAKKDQEFWIEVIAERLGSHADPQLRIERITTDDKDTEQFQEIRNADDAGDDPGERLFPLPCRDPQTSLKIPEDGTYRLTVMNQAGPGGADQVYRLTLREPQPSFDLIAVPWQQLRVGNKVGMSTPILRPGGTTELRVFAMRHEGFSGEIELTVEGRPPSVSCAPVSMGGGRTASVSLAAPFDAARWDGFITIRGKSGDLTRKARLGTIPWPVNDWSKQFFETRLGTSIPLTVTDAEKVPVTVKSSERRHIEITMGDQFELPVQLLKNTPNAAEFVIRSEGLPHKRPELKIPGNADGGTLVIASGKEDEFPREPGTWTFRLKAEGTVEYTPSQAAVTHARAVHEHLANRERDHLAELEHLREARDQALHQLDGAERDLRDGHPTSLTQLAALRSKLDDAAAQLQSAQETALTVRSQLELATARAKTAEQSARKQNVRIVTHSKPITITVKPASKAEEATP